MDPSILSSYGLAGLVIATLAGVVAYQDRKIGKLQDKYDELQNRRYVEAQADKEKLVEPLEEQSRLTKTIYEFLLSSKRGR